MFFTSPASECLNHIVRFTNGGTTLISGAGSPCSLQLSIISPIPRPQASILQPNSLTSPSTVTKYIKDKLPLGFYGEKKYSVTNSVSHRFATLSKFYNLSICFITWFTPSGISFDDKAGTGIPNKRQYRPAPVSAAEMIPGKVMPVRRKETGPYSQNQWSAEPDRS